MIVMQYYFIEYYESLDNTKGDRMRNLIEKIELKKGAHKNIEDGACIMELVSYIAGEPWSDNPKCACPILTSFAIGINDSMDDEWRQKLKPIIPKLLNSRDENKRKIRAEFFAHQAITVFLPILTDALELVEISDRLREFKIGEWVDARDYIASIRQTLRDKTVIVAYDTAAAAAAYDAAYYATGAYNAAYYAAAAAYDAAYYAAYRRRLRRRLLCRLRR